MSATNTLPAFPALENYVALPLHVMDTATHACTFCGEEPIWDTYASYLDHYAADYEGPWLAGPYSPDDEDTFDYFASTCRA